MFHWMIVITCLAEIVAVQSVRLELHFESLCKQCQIHTAGIDDIVIHGGSESSMEDAGMMKELEMSVDYYGFPDCVSHAEKWHTEHGPDLCYTDRYHLCAQSLGGGTAQGAAQLWWPFVHCMFMNMDQLKCGVNEHCEDHSRYESVVNGAVALCSSVSGMDGDAITACATGSEGEALAKESYKRTDKTLLDGFAPAYINGEKLEGADEIWRKTPDQLLYGKTMLSTLCGVMTQNGANSTLPDACKRL